jgi:LysM repeat protein
MTTKVICFNLKEQWIRSFFTCLSITLFLLPANAREKNQNYIDYIDQYHQLAVSHMKIYRIPASITLAQGLLESGAGKSRFTQASNNHFGIKCHEWKGEKIYYDDDTRNECFRKYKQAADSYDDHSRFLSERPRYASLFDLDVKDYKAWAKGLSKCGYATDPGYANKLIKLIEDYELYRYDDLKVKYKIDRPRSNKSSNVAGVKQREVYKTHGLIYVVAGKDDTFDSIAFDLGFKVGDLLKYNEVPEGFPLYKGDIVYLEKKKKKADKPNYEHVVQVGESMHSISQQYGIRLHNLYRMNKKDEEYVPVEGDVLRLR